MISMVLKIAVISAALAVPSLCGNSGISVRFFVVSESYTDGITKGAPVVGANPGWIIVDHSGLVMLMATPEGSSPASAITPVACSEDRFEHCYYFRGAKEKDFGYVFVSDKLLEVRAYGTTVIF